MHTRSSTAELPATKHRRTVSAKDVPSADADGNAPPPPVHDPEVGGESSDPAGPAAVSPDAAFRNALASMTRVTSEDVRELVAPPTAEEHQGRTYRIVVDPATRAVVMSDAEADEDSDLDDLPELEVVQDSAPAQPAHVAVVQGGPLAVTGTAAAVLGHEAVLGHSAVAAHFAATPALVTATATSASSTGASTTPLAAGIPTVDDVVAPPTSTPTPVVGQTSTTIVTQGTTMPAAGQTTTTIAPHDIPSATPVALPAVLTQVFAAPTVAAALPSTAPPPPYAPAATAPLQTYGQGAAAALPIAAGPGPAGFVNVPPAGFANVPMQGAYGALGGGAVPANLAGNLTAHIGGTPPAAIGLPGNAVTLPTAPLPADAQTLAAGQLNNTALTGHPYVYGVEGLTTALVQRLRTLANYVYPPLNTFSVSLAPANSDWGRGRDERFLVYDNRAVGLWLAGRAKKLWFHKPNGEAQTRVSIGLELSVAGDLDAVKALYGRARPRATLTNDIVYASRLQTVRERGATSALAIPFDEVYDATEAFTAKSLMPRLRAADLAENDIVLVECNFTRWKKQGETKKKMWTSWDVGFELISIALLYAEPADTAGGAGEDVPAAANQMFSI